MNFKNMHLLISASLIICIAIIYGIMPNKVLPILFDFRVETVDLKNVFRAIMGLYIGFAVYWIYGTLNNNAWKAATISCTIFMGGLAFGRIVSFLADTLPSTLFTIGLIVEIILCIWGVLNVMKVKKK